MKAIVLNALGGVEHFSEIDLPIPQPKEGEVRIRLKAAAFNPVDAKMRLGEYKLTLPKILGADASGVIDAVGKNVKDFKEGDEVSALVFGQGSNGTYAEYVCISTDFVIHKPKMLSFEQAAAFPLVALTAYRAVIEKNAIMGSQPVFVAGGGGSVGALAIQLLQYLKIGPIFTTAGGEEALSYLIKERKLKKEHILMYKGLGLEEMKQTLLSLNQNELFKASFDFIGGLMKLLCLAITNYSGHMVTILSEKEEIAREFFNKGAGGAFSKSLSVHFVFVGSESYYGSPQSWKVYKQQLEKIVRLINEKQLIISPPHVVGALSAVTVREAHLLLEKGQAKGKLAMTI